MHWLSQLVFLLFFALSLSEATKFGGKDKSNILIDVSRDYINKAKSLYPNCSEEASECRKIVNAVVLLDAALNTLNTLSKDFYTCPDAECPKQLVDRPMDCAEILGSGEKQSGVYSIWPRSRITNDRPLAVYCDMDTDGGGWTVIQRRGQFKTPKDFFYKDWADYKKGFGDNITEEFWIGNDNIYAISNQANYSIRFDLKDHKGETGYAVYNTFWIEDEAAQYKLHIDGYSGNVDDGMSENNLMKFSTRDRKNDNWVRACAVEDQGAWWYDQCSGVNLNGLYQPGTDSDKGVTWYSWKKNRVGLAGVEIKLRP